MSEVIGVVGAGTMGNGIAQVSARARDALWSRRTGSPEFVDQLGWYGRLLPASVGARPEMGEHESVPAEPVRRRGTGDEGVVALGRAVRDDAGHGRSERADRRELAHAPVIASVYEDCGVRCTVQRACSARRYDDADVSRSRHLLMWSSQRTTKVTKITKNTIFIYS